MTIQYLPARRGRSFSSLLMASIAALALSACANNRDNIVVGDAVCASPVPPRRTPLPVATPAQRAGLLAAGFSPEAVHIADVIGAAGPLLASVETSTGRNGQPVFNSIANNHVALSVDRAILEVQGTLSSLNCQGARIGELQDDLNQRQAVITNRFAMAGIAIGAGTAVVSGGLGFLANSAPASVTGIAGGALGGLLSVLQLDVNATGHLRLQQNILEELWRAPENPTFFPRRIWRYLNTRTNPGEQTPREMIMASWRHDGLVPDQDPTPEPPPMILDRDAMGADDLGKLKLLLEPLEARIGLMARDLGRLIEELLERSEEAALSRQTAPARRRPAA